MYGSFLNQDRRPPSHGRTSGILDKDEVPFQERPSSGVWVRMSRVMTECVRIWGTNGRNLKNPSSGHGILWRRNRCPPMILVCWLPIACCGIAIHSHNNWSSYQDSDSGPKGLDTPKRYVFYRLMYAHHKCSECLWWVLCRPQDSCNGPTTFDVMLSDFNENGDMSHAENTDGQKKKSQRNIRT